MRVRLLGVGFVVAVAAIGGCGGATGAGVASSSGATISAVEGELVLYSNNVAQSFRIEGTRIWGPNAELTRFEHGYRGVLRGAVVDLHLDTEKQRVHGMIGAQPIDVHVTASEGQLQGRGILGGRLSEHELDDAVLGGSFGRCSYSLKRDKPELATYVGFRTCDDGATHPFTRVTLTSAVRALPPLDQIALLALLLSA